MNGPKMAPDTNPGVPFKKGEQKPMMPGVDHAFITEK